MSTREADLPLRGSFRAAFKTAFYRVPPEPIGLPRGQQETEPWFLPGLAPSSAKGCPAFPSHHQAPPLPLDLLLIFAVVRLPGRYDP